MNVFIFCPLSQLTSGREQSMKPMIGKSIDQSITIDEQSMLEVYVIIDFIDYVFLSIINTNRSVNLHRFSLICCHFLCVLFSVQISKTRSLYASKNDENCRAQSVFLALGAVVRPGVNF